MTTPDEVTTSEPGRPAQVRRPEHLARGPGLRDAALIVVGSMIGSGIFITSAESTRLVGAPGWLWAAWALAGLLTVKGALCCAGLAATMPRSGGQYVFPREAYGPALGFLFGCPPGRRATPSSRPSTSRSPRSSSASPSRASPRASASCSC